MGFFSNLFQNKAELLDWQNVLLQQKSNKLIMSRDLLIKNTIQRLQDDLRIFDDCANLINSTVKPDVFFSRLELAEEKLLHIVDLEPFTRNVKEIEFNAPPQMLLRKFQCEKQEYISTFITRCQCAVEEKAAGMKTDKGRHNQFVKLHESLKPYYHRMTDSMVSNFEEYMKDK